MKQHLLPYNRYQPILGRHVFVAETAAIIGDVVIGDQTNIWFGVSIRGDVNYIRIGSRTNIQDGSVVHVTHKTHPTFIGDGVTVGHMALLHGCTIEDHAFIGMKSCVMDGAVIESGGMVAAGALITPGKRVKSGELWAGVPGKLVRMLTPEEHHFIPISAQHYVDLAASYMDPLNHDDCCQ